MKPKWLRIVGAILALIGAVGIGFKALLGTTMIVALGIHATSFLATVAYIVAGLGGASFAASFVPQLKSSVEQNRNIKLLKDKNDAENENTTSYESDSLNPEKVKIRLEQLKARNPNLEGLIDKCLTQKYAIDKYQEQLGRLIKANEAAYLEDVPDVLNNAEKRMCANFRDIINCCILVEYSGEAISESNEEIVESSLVKNEEELKSVRILLDHSVAYINDYNRKGISDRSELDAWIKTMEKKINKKGEFTLD